MNGVGSDWKRALVKVVLGVVVLGVAFGYRALTTTEVPPAQDVEVVPLETPPPWEAFPVLAAEWPADSTAAAAPHPRVSFVYTPSDCSPYLDEMEAWARVLEIYPELSMVGVLQVESATLGRRFAKTYPDPFPTRIDTTAWFQRSAGLQQTPVLVFHAPGETAHIVAPRTRRTDVERQQLIEDLLPFWTSSIASPSSPNEV